MVSLTCLTPQNSQKNCRAAWDSALTVFVTQNSCPSFFTGKQYAKRPNTKAARFLKADLKLVQSFWWNSVDQNKLQGHPDSRSGEIASHLWWELGQACRGGSVMDCWQPSLQPLCLQSLSDQNLKKQKRWPTGIANV